MAAIMMIRAIKLMRMSQFRSLFLVGQKFLMPSSMASEIGS